MRNDTIFWIMLIWIAWTGYEIGKEAKTNWFSNNYSQEKSRLFENNSIDNNRQKLDSKLEHLKTTNDDNLDK